MFILLHKKSDPRACFNYRAIFLVLHASRVLLQVMLEQIPAKVKSYWIYQITRPVSDQGVEHGTIQ